MNEFIKDTIERALYTFCEAMLGFITIGMPVYSVDWLGALSISATAAIVTIFKQLVKYLNDAEKAVEVLDEVDSIDEVE